MKTIKKTTILLLIIISIISSNFSPIIVQAKSLSNNSFAAYSWILLDEKYDGEKITINKIQIGTDKDSEEKVIIINYTYKKSKKYAYIELYNGEPMYDTYLPMYQMEHDDFSDQHLRLGTFSYKDDLENAATIGKSLKIKDVKKLYKKYKEADEYTIIS